ncbi:hypothetical protein CFBP4996_25480 [Agrobacterium leguminum]|nr:hypothetical protein [Agrobacterium leguminum]WFS69328.1 hypothetical protein CFBP4996_25480 [Agrobacterium leguminum]
MTETRLLKEMTATHADHERDDDEDDDKSEKRFPDPEGHGNQS